MQIYFPDLVCRKSSNIRILCGNRVETCCYARDTCAVWAYYISDKSFPSAYTQDSRLWLCRHTDGTKASWAASSPLWQKQILPHLPLFCLKASHRYDFLPTVRELKMKISKLGVRESCRSMTLNSHLLSSWTCEYWKWSIWFAQAPPLISHLLSAIFLYSYFLQCHLNVMGFSFFPSFILFLFFSVFLYQFCVWIERHFIFTLLL